MTRTKTILLLGAAALLAGGGLVLAQEGMPGRHVHAPMAWDLRKMMDKDGKVTRAEFDKALADRFAELSGGSDTITADQFAVRRDDRMAKRASEMFNRLDWNQDGKISPEEFTAAEHGRFQMMDPDGSGIVSCNAPETKPHDGMGPPPEGAEGPPPPDGPGPRHGLWMHRGRAMMDRHFCADNDLDKDGKVTRVEFDSAIAKHFAEISGATGGISPDQLAAEVARQGREMSDAMFHRLDKNGDGKLTLAEFSAPEDGMFDRLDKNRDGIVAKDEMKMGFHHHHGHRSDGHSQQPAKPQSS